MTKIIRQKLISFFLIVTTIFTAHFALADGLKTKVGVIVPLSGPLAEYGVAFRNGVTLATKEIANTNCSFVFEDSKYDPKVTIGVFQKLTQIEKVSVIYNFGGPTTEAIVPLAESKKTLLITSETEPRFSIGKKFVVRLNSPSAEFGKVLSQEFEKSGYKKIGIIRTENQYVNGIYEALKQSLPKSIVLEDISVVLPTEQDFHSIIPKFAKDKYDSIGVFLLPGQISTFYKQLSELGIKLKTFGLDLFESPVEISSSGSGIEGAVFPNNETTEEFQKNYKNAFNNLAQIQYAGFGYDFASLAERNICKPGEATRSSEQMLASLKESDSNNGVNGNYKFIETAEGDKYFAFPVVLRKVENGQLVTVRRE